MKTIITTLIVLLLIGQTFAQKTIKIDGLNDQEINTVFKKNKRDGFYGSISLGYSPIDKKDGFVASTRGCWIMDHWFSFGLGGTGFVNNVDDFNNYSYNYSSTQDSDPSLAGGYGGLILEPMLAPLKPIHLSFPILLGFGGASSYRSYSNSSYSSSSYPNAEDFFFVVEPGIELEINFTKWMRIAAFATYRYTSDIDITNVTKNALRSYSTGLTLKVGLF